MNNGPDKINDLNTLSSVNQDISVIRNNSKMKYSVLSAQGDLTLPYKWINIDAGIKYTLLDNKSDIGYYDFDGTDYILNQIIVMFFGIKNTIMQFMWGQKDFGKMVCESWIEI